MKEKVKSRNRYLPLIKIAGSMAALFLLYKQIDFKATYGIITRANPLWIITALLLFNISQIISAVRLNYFFKNIGIQLTMVFNLRLYYIGMFYNLLIPGGIGGDAYKGYLLKKYMRASVRRLAGAMIADRASGLFGIVFLLIILALILQESIAVKVIYIIAVGLLSLILGWVAFRLLFPLFKRIFVVTAGYSLIVQGLQAASVYAIIHSLDINDSITAYLFIFLISSVATIIPVTVGGLGLREIVFLYGARYFSLDPEVSVAVSLIFFALTALSSLPGLILNNLLTRQSWLKQSELS